MKFISLLVSKASKKDSTSHERLEKSKVRVAIESICEQYLVNFNDVLTFEALPSALDNTLELIEEQALTNKYEFEQISDTLFRVRLKEVNVL